MSGGAAIIMANVVRTRDELDRELAALRASGSPVALVPTMGALHEGHLSLIERARELSENVVVSVFVNPLQFGPREDFRSYPRDLERDVALAGDKGAQLIFAPEDVVMYPRGAPDVHVEPGSLGERLCGAFRPGHFRGVLTVVAKLFGLVRPDVAVFGRKDYQQAVLIRRMVEDLDLGVTIDVAPLVREADGLAMSSRNAYLSPKEREEAPGLWRALDAADQRFRGGENRVAALTATFRDVLIRHWGLTLQYVECVHPETLDPLDEAATGSVMAAAVLCGSTRLIDNVVLGSPTPDPRTPEARPP